MYCCVSLNNDQQLSLISNTQLYIRLLFYIKHMKTNCPTQIPKTQIYQQHLKMSVLNDDMIFVQRRGWGGGGGGMLLLS